jgi:hypothetical protein
MGGVMVSNEWMRKKVTRGWVDVDATRCELGSSRSKQVWRVLGMDGWLLLLCCCYVRAAAAVEVAGITKSCGRADCTRQMAG